MKKNLLKKMGILCVAMSCLFAVGCTGEDVEDINGGIEESFTGSNTVGSIEETESVIETETDEETGDLEMELSSEEMIDKFLNDEITVTVGDEVGLGYFDFDKEHEGEKITFSELTAVISTIEDQEDADPIVSNYILEKEDEKILLLRYEGVNIEGAGDESYSYFVIARDGDELVLTYSVNAWSRCYVEMNEAGIIQSSGSAGAGEQIAEVGYINEYGEYELIASADACFPGWIGSMFEYCSAITFSEETVELAKEYDALDDAGAVYFYYVDDEVYGIFDDVDTDEAVALIEAAKEDGLTIVTEDEIETILDDYVEAIGLDYDDIEADEIAW